MGGPRRRESLGHRLAGEFRDYLADLRQLSASLRRVEGVVALLLVLVILGLVIAWFFLGLGFDRLLSAAAALGAIRPRACRDVSDGQGLVLVIGGVVFILLALLAVGEMMRLIDRVRQRQPGRPSAVLFPTLAMLIAGIAGLIVMRSWC